MIKRSQQVKIMGEIYSMANKILVWTGESSAEM